MEPYLLSRLARQFRYSQLYVGNPNQKLDFQGNIFAEAQARYHFCASGMGAQFTVPHKMPKNSPFLTRCPTYLSLSFCTWYHAANAITSFYMNHDCMKEIKAYYSTKKSAKRSRLWGIYEFLNSKYDDEGEDEEGATRVGTKQRRERVTV